MTTPRRIIPAGAAALLAALAGPALAQSADAARIKELERKLERSLELIEQLSQKISKIEQASAAAPAAQAKASEQTTRIEQIERHISQIGQGLSRRQADDGEPVHGFIDVGAVRSGENNPTNTGRKGGALGYVDLYLTPQFGRVKTLIELAFEAESDGSTAADLERLQIGYTFNDAATGWLGRFHTPYGYWNTAYHHGAQIQTTVTRPIFLEFEHDNGILPAHTVGGWLTGSVNRDGNRLGYDLFLGNAPQITRRGNATVPTALATSNPAGFGAAVNAGGYAGAGTIDLRQQGSSSHRTSAGFNAWIEPQAVDGLRLGVHGMRADIIDDAPVTPNRTLLAMFGGHATYITDPWEVMAEYYRFRNRDRSGGTGTHGSWAGYAQAGYNFGKWTPYGRLERTRFDQTDNYFAVLEGGRSYRRLTAGLRYEVDPKAALKLEFASTRKEDLGPGLTDRYPELHLQYSVRF